MVSFPDEMPADQIRSLIAQKFPLETQPSYLSGTFSDVPKEIKSAALSAMNTINANLNPFSAERRAAVMEQANAPSFLSSLGKGVQQTLGVGSGLASIPLVPASPFIGTAQSVLGHPMAAAEHATGSLIAPELAAKDNPQEMYEKAKQDVTTAISAVAPRGATPTGLRTIPAPAPSAAEIETAATSVFKDPRIANIPIPRQDAVNLSARIENDLINAHFRERQAKGTFQEIRDIVPPQGANLTVTDIRSSRMALARDAKETVDGKPTPNAAAATQAVKAIDAYLDTLAPELKQANANYAAAQRAKDFDFKEQKALDQAASANSGMNIENRLRAQVRQILTSKKAQRGYSAEELNAFRQFNRGVRSANIVRAVGNILAGGGGIGMPVVGATSAYALGPPGWALPIIGWGTKTLGNRLALSKFDQLSQMIRGRSPLAQSLPPQVLPQPGALSGSVPFLTGNRALFPYLNTPIPAYADQNQRR